MQSQSAFELEAKLSPHTKRSPNPPLLRKASRAAHFCRAQKIPRKLPRMTGPCPLAR